MNEDEVIARLSARLGSTSAKGSRLGDDVAWLEPFGLVASVDSQIEGVHYLAAALPPERVARRLVAVNLSDLAASACSPRFGLLALSAPKGFPVDAFLAEVAANLSSYGAELVGGDLARSERMTASLTVLGEPVRPGPLLGRSCAKVGDQLWLGGVVGEAALGCHLAAAGGIWPVQAAEPVVPDAVPERFHQVARRALRRHFEPVPQLQVGLALGRRGERFAAIDISDGLAKDAGRIARASGVRLCLDLEALLATPAFGEVSQLAAFLGLDATDLALSGGEDYALLIAGAGPISGPGSLSELDLLPVGTVEEGSGLRRRIGSQSVDLAPSGWDHLDQG